jgi:hypothetical protein
MSAVVEEVEARLSSPATQLGWLGCIVIVAPPEHHAMIKALMRRAVDAGLVGPVALLSATDDDTARDHQLTHALRVLLDR